MPIGDTLAKDLTRLVDANWSVVERPVSRYLWYVTITANERAALDGALDALDVRSASRSTPIDDTMAAPPGLPPWAPRIVLATIDDLAAHPALLKRVGMPAGSWAPALEGQSWAVFRRTTPDGTMLFVIAADGAAALGTAMSGFARLPRMVEEGWTSSPRSP